MTTKSKSSSRNKRTSKLGADAGAGERSDTRRRLPDYARDWPRKGGFGDAPQPWDLAAQGIDVMVPANVQPNEPPVVKVTTADGERIELEPGAPDVVSPIVVDHGRPMLTYGSIDVGPGPAVAGAVTELGQLLGRLGYENSVTRGTNYFGVFDDTLGAAVERFREDYDVREDPSQFARNGRRNAETHVGPWTWEAILRAVALLEAKADDDRRQLTHPRR